MTSLSVADNTLGPQGAVELAPALGQCLLLAHLDLEGNGIGNRGADAIASALRSSPALSHLSLRYNGIGRAGATHLGAALERNTSLTRLDLGYNEVGVRGAAAITRSWISAQSRGQSLQRRLDLWQNNIGAEFSEVVKGQAARFNILTSAS